MTENSCIIVEHFGKFLTKAEGYKQFGYFCLMKALQRIFNFYLDASIHVALAIFLLLKVSEITFNISSGIHLGQFLFFGSICCYNFIKYGVEAEKYIVVANDYHRGIQFFSLITLVFALYHSYFLNLNTWLGVGCLVALTGCYAFPVLPNTKNLRSWGSVKVFVVALVWAGATVVLPVLSSEQLISWDVQVEALQRFLLVLILLVPFEIRDLQFDNEQLRTLPQRFGVAQTKILGAFGTLFFFFLTFLKDEISTIELLSKGILFLALSIIIFITKKKQSKYFASFWVESIPIFWWMLLVGLEQLFKIYPEVAPSF